jgi:hypothetical protein
MHKISQLVQGKGDSDTINLDGVSLPVKALKKLLEEGYENLKVFSDTKTISTWGKNCTACFTEALLRERAK